MNKLRLLLIIFTLGIISSGCTKESAPPDLPPEGSFVMQIDNMWDDGSPGPIEASMTESRTNFIFAAANVLWWNAVITVQMAVPAASFLESFNHEAEWDRAGKEWIWTYSFDLNEYTYTAELHGKTGDDGINWSMYISKSDVYTDFLWFTGISATDNKSGTWTLNKDPESIVKDEMDTIPFIEINWSVDDDGTAEIKYTNIEENAANFGNYIHYGRTDDIDLDAFYDIYKSWEDNLISIKWNSTENYGRVLSMPHFTDPYWHCWDEFLRNIACED
jgi:hypothetical protein